MSYFSWGTYRDFAGCAYSLGKTLCREAQVLFYHHSRGCIALAAAELLGYALPHEILLNPQWAPRCATNGPKHAKKPAPGLQMSPKWHPKVTFGRPWGRPWCKLAGKATFGENISFCYGYNTWSNVPGRHFQDIWPPNSTPGATKDEHCNHVLPKCPQMCAK